MPVKGLLSPVGEKAGHQERSRSGHGCSSSHCCQCRAKLRGFVSSRRNHMSLPPHSILRRSHLEGADLPRNRSPFLREAMTSGELGRSLPSLSTHAKLARRTNESPSNEAVHSSLRAPVERA